MFDIYRFASVVCLADYAERAVVFSYLAAVTLTSYRAANVDLYLALMTLSSEGSLTFYTYMYCDIGP